MFNVPVDDNPGKLPIGEVENSMDEFISPVTELLPYKLQPPSCHRLYVG